MVSHDTQSDCYFPFPYSAFLGFQPYRPHVAFLDGLCSSFGYIGFLADLLLVFEKVGAKTKDKNKTDAQLMRIGFSLVAEA